ncbi:MAG TPA: hypothetical protein VFS67_29110 [Polyangiaceae bacterium]|nr:hypothetical protein [Polyangiaceae bacterium]
MARRRRLWCAAAAIAAGSLLGCGANKRTGLGPEVALASSPEAQAQFRALREQWTSTPPDARVGLERAFTSFIQRFPDDPEGRWIRIYLAWIALARGDLPLSERWLGLADPGPYGAASDLAEVVRASIDLAAGRAPTAYAKLFALEGRLIDPDDRMLCLDRLVLASLAVHRYEDAVHQMLELAALAARRHRERLWRTLEPRLAEVPLPVLEATLPRLSVSAIESPSVRPAERAAAVDWMRQQILEVLSRSAITHRDVELAQRLVASGPLPGGASASAAGSGASSHKGTPDRSELLWLATQGSLTPSIRGRTLGLALELGDPVTRQRSLDVASGISVTLALAQRAAEADEPQLETRPVDGGALGDTLARLAGDGAGLLVAGLDAHGAAVAAEFAATHAIPVLLLEEPEGGGELPPFTYLVGADDRAASQLLRQALEPRTDALLSVGASAAPCSDHSSELPPELAQAQSEVRRPGLLVLGGAECSSLLGALDRRWTIGLGLSALGLRLDDLRAHEVWTLATGRLPRLEPTQDPEASRWFSKKGHAPRWFEALGHDIARIAEAVLPPATAASVRDPTSVAETHRQIVARLDSLSQRELWTSSEGKFERRKLVRQLRAERREPAAAQ